MQETGNRQALKKLLFMIFITVIVQIAALVKGAIIASNFGAGIEMDAFNLTTSISNFIFSFLGAGITTVLIPAYINKNSEKSINSFITLLYGLAVFLVAFLVLNQNWLMKMFSAGSLYFVETACSVLILNLLAHFFTSLSGVTNAYFQCCDRFITPKIINLSVSAVTIVILFSIKNLTIYKYALILMLLALIDSILQIYIASKNGFKFKLSISFNDSELKKLIKIFIPTIFSTGLYQISLLTDSLITSYLGEGNLSILSYSNNLMSMVSVLIVSNLITYIYPKIALDITHNEKQKSQERFFDYILFFVAIMFLVLIGFIIVGKEGISLLYERGKFTPEITSIVFECTLLYMLGLPINIARDLIYRFFYAHGDTKATFKNSIIVSIVNIVVSIILVNIIGIEGVILGTVISSVISLIMISLRFKKKFTFLFNKKLFIYELIKLIFICVTTLVILLTLKNIFVINSIIISALIFGFITVFIFIILCVILKSKILKVNLN